MAGVAGRTTSEAKDTAPAYVFAASTVALAFVLYLGYASYVVLKTFCILCAITYVSVIAIFIISGGATSFPMTTLPRRASKDLRTLVSNPLPFALALVFAAGAAVVLAAFPRESGTAPQAPTAEALPPVTDAERANVTKWWEIQPVVTVPVPADGAKVVVVKFNDYQCGACKLTFDAYKPVFAKYAANKQFRYIVKHFPLEGECNAAAPGGNHYASCEAAAGVLMARSKGTSGKLEDWIFGNIGPPALTPDQVKEAIRTVGGVTDFDAQYPRVLQEVKADASLGALLNVDSTPTFFINGKRLPKTQVQPQYLDLLIEIELNRATK
jgi:protein-disulfide isomerase